MDKQIRMGGFLKKFICVSQTQRKQIWMGWFLAKQNWPRLSLILILLLAFFIRFINLGSNPPELFSDEITHVLSARTILETGKDINGKLNLYLYNRLKLGAPIYGYTAAFSTYIFGNNTVAIRLPAALAGTLTVFLIYKLCLLVIKDKRISLLAAFITALTPWNIYFSRIAWEPSLILPFILSGILIFYYGVESGKTKNIILPYIVFAIAVYGADALEFLSPVFLAVLILLNIKRIWKNKYKHALGLTVFVILLIPYAFIVINNPLKYSRSVKISTFATGINTKNVKIFTKNYLAHFSPVFLFEKGDPNLRQGTGQDGVLYWALLPFIVIGLIFAIKNIRRKHYLFILIWLLIFPLGGSLTNDGVPHATRTLIGNPALIVMSGIGFTYVLGLIKREGGKILFISLFVFVIVLEFVNFAHSYFLIYPINSQPWWDYGEKKIFLSIKANTKGNESLCLPNVEYWHADTYPNYYLGLGNKYRMTFYLDNPDCLASDVLVLRSGEISPSGYSVIDTIYDLSGNPIWSIYKDSSL